MYIYMSISTNLAWSSAGGFGVGVGTGAPFCISSICLSSALSLSRACTNSDDFWASLSSALCALCSVSLLYKQLHYIAVICCKRACACVTVICCKKAWACKHWIKLAYRVCLREMRKWRENPKMSIFRKIHCKRLNIKRDGTKILSL